MLSAEMKRKKMNKYWAKRKLDESQAFQKTSETKLLKKLAREYRRMAEEVSNELENLYYKILSESFDGEPLVSHLYQYNRYYETLGSIQNKLIELGMKETDYFEKSLTDLYKDNGKRIGKQFNIPFDTTDEQVKDVIYKVWAPDEMNWSQRIWKHEGQLLNRLSSTLIDAVQLGISPDKLTERIMIDFGVGFYEANRLVVTESSYIMNQSCADAALEAGCDEYEYLGDQDGACKECAELNGKIFKFKDMQVGVNCPPAHPNCRCTILPVLEG